MKLFVLVSRVPFPLEKGDKLRAYHQIKQLSKDFDVHLCCLNDQVHDANAQKELEKIAHTVSIVQLSKWRVYLNVFFGLFGDLPLQVHYFYQRKANKQIQHLIKTFKPDHIYCQLIRTSEYVKELHQYPKTLDYMDAFSKGIDRRVSTSPLWKRWIMKAEARRLASYENIIFDYFDHHTIISKQDQQHLFHAKRDKIAVVANGVDTVYFTRKEKEQSYTLLFTGNMSYPPNIDCAEYLVHEVLPLVQKNFPQATLCLAGANPSPKVKALASNTVTVTGWIEDIRDAYNSSKVFVAPMRIGTGLQNKLLEAMSMELPAITSSLANNALGAESEKTILIADDAETCALQIKRLLINENLGSDIAKAGKNFVKEKYTWEGTGQILKKIIGSEV